MRRFRSERVLVLVLCVWAVLCGPPRLAAARCDEAKIHSGNIERHLTPGAGHPLVGFWRSECENDFGLAIDQAGSGLYSISFCGPGGCFEPGTYRPSSPILGDPAYHLASPDTLEVLGADGFTPYHRCASSDSGREL